MTSSRPDAPVSYDPAADRARLAELISELAVVRGRVTLSSGKEADYYIDLRRITLHHEAAPLVGRVMIQMLAEAGIDYDAVGGLTMGADPVATSMLHQQYVHPDAALRQVRFDSFVVRKAAKQHGMARQVEGPEVSGRKVVVLEDTSTTGGSALTAVEGVRKAGADVQAVAVLVDRDTGAAERVAEEAQVPYLFDYSLEDLNI